MAATPRDYKPDVTKWVEVKHPKDPHYADVVGTFDYQWVVSRRGNQVYAHLIGWRELLKWLASMPPFVPRASSPEYRHLTHYSAIHVRDGWLVGFNEGEFGAALFWFSEDGRRNYKVSDDQIVDFQRTPQGILAIQGLAHGNTNIGSVVRIVENAQTGRWTSTELKPLPQEPESWVQLSDGRVFIVLFGSLVLLTADNRLETLTESANWLRPDSIVASADTKRIYIGTCPYVCEYHMETRQLRYLVPNASMAQRLSKPQSGPEG